MIFTNEKSNSGMELEGRITNAENLAAIISKAGSERMSGTFTLRCGASVVKLEFQNGMLCGSENPERGRRLGQILLSRGLITRAALEEALAFQQDFSPETPIGRVLIHRKHLTDDSLRDAVRLQLEDEIADILTCGEGLFQFDVQKPDEEPPLVELEPAKVITEVVSRQPEWERIRLRVPDDRLVPSVIGLKCSSDREMMHLTKNEWQILSLINGYYDVGCIAARSGLGRFETYKTITSFLTTGLIELKKNSESVPTNFGDENGQLADRNAASKAAGSTSTRWGGILARLRDEAENGSLPDSSRLQFDSPVAFLTAVCNHIIDRLMLKEDFIVDPSDERLAERYWRQVLMSHPRADLVRVDGNILNSDSFDRYTRSLGVEELLKSIYLETMDGLMRFLRTLYLLSAQRLGFRIARSLFVDAMENLKQRSTVKNSDSFFFKEVAAKILE